MKSYKYLDIATVIFVVVLFLSNFIAHNKFAQVGDFVFGTGIIFFPVSYLLGDILTEVYGYAASRRVIWIGFFVLVVSAISIQIILAIPPANGWNNQEAYMTVFGNSLRTVLCSVFAFWAGEFTNSFILAKMKILTNGKYLWTRTIGSTVVGEAIDTLIFYPLALLLLLKCHCQRFPALFA